MREQLERYVDLLFAGAPEAAEVKQEILQNTLDRYDDLIDQGKSPEAAYRLAISGIGDINEILGQPVAPAVPAAPAEPVSESGKRKNPALAAAVQRALGVAAFILCPVPVLAVQDVEGVICLLIMVAGGVALMILAAFNRKTGKGRPPHPSGKAAEKPEQSGLDVRRGGVSDRQLSDPGLGQKADDQIHHRGERPDQTVQAFPQLFLRGAGGVLFLFSC